MNKVANRQEKTPLNSPSKDFTTAVLFSEKHVQIFDLTDSLAQSAIVNAGIEKQLEGLGWKTELVQELHNRCQSALALTLCGQLKPSIQYSLSLYSNLGVIIVDSHSKVIDLNIDNRIVYLGLRDLSGNEKQYLKKRKIKAFSMQDIDRDGIAKVTEQIFDYLGRKCPIHFSFDLSALDPIVAPSNGSFARGGLTFREAHYICEEVWQSKQLIAMNMTVREGYYANEERVENQKITVGIGCSLIRSALGETLL